MMPLIGNPKTSGDKKFSQIKMRSATQKLDPKKQKEELLKKINGERGNVKFVEERDHNKIGKDEFLKLLTHQLSQQDPLNPMDQKQFAADLAQFTQLEQMANMRTELQKQNENRAAENKFYAASFLGKKVITSGTTIDYKGELDVDIPFSLPKNAKKVMIRIFDEANQLIAQIDKDSIPKGSRVISWDGISLDKSQAANGSYTVEVRAWDNDFNQFLGETKSHGIVTGVNFDNKEMVLSLDGKKSVFLRDVERFEVVKHNVNNNNKLVNSETVKNAYKNNQVTE